MNNLFFILKTRLVKFLSDEIAHGELAKAKRSCEKFWVKTKKHNTQIYKQTNNIQPQDKHEQPETQI